METARHETCSVQERRGGLRLGLASTESYGAAMRPVRILGYYIGFVFLGGALLAPLLYWSAQNLSQTFPYIAQHPFHRFVARAFLILALLGLWPLFRALGAKSVKDLGLISPIGQTRHFAAGFALGLISLGIQALITLGVGASKPVPQLHNAGSKIFSAALTAIVVGTLEEILFRGGIFGALRRNLHWVRALVASSVVYALVHFLTNAAQSGPVTWYSGLALLPRMFQGFFHWKQLLPGLLNLTLAGSILALAYHRTGNLYYSMGLHSGWVFCLKSYGIFTRHAQGANAWLWGANKMIEGWLALLVLTATLFWVIKSPTAQRETSAPPQPRPV